MRLADSDITVEETDQWQKIILPAESNRFLFVFYSVAMLVWMGMLVVVVVGLFRPFVEGRPFYSSLVWRGLMVLWLLVWIYFARRWLWRNWQYYAATREILFVGEEEFIIRRPVSLLGLTDVYDKAHIDRIEMDREGGFLSFAYGSRPVRFARGVDMSAAQRLVSLLNRQHFGEEEDDDVF